MYLTLRLSPLLLFLFLFFLLLFLYLLLRLLFFLLRFLDLYFLLCFLYILLGFVYVPLPATRPRTEYRGKSSDEEDDDFSSQGSPFGGTPLSMYDAYIYAQVGSAKNLKGI